MRRTSRFHELPLRKQVDFRNPRLPWTSRPIVRVRLSLGVDRFWRGHNPLPYFTGKALGIEHFEREGRVFGISGEKMPIYYHKLKLQLDGMDEPMEIEAGFVDSPGVGALLGQSGFFEHFRICFDRRKEEIEIRPAESES